MRPGGGKHKGGAFERDVCRRISRFWSAGAFDDLLWRAASSGAKGTVTRTKNKAFHADIVATSPLTEPLMKVFSIECKFYKNIDITEILRGLKNNKILTFWGQTLKSARLSGRRPALIARRNMFPTMLIIQTVDMHTFACTMKKAIPYMTLGDKLSVFNFEEFLENVNHKKFVTLVEELSLDNDQAA